MHALRDLSFELNPGESLGFVGESGSGKSITGLSILGLLARNAKIESGEIFFHQTDLLKARAAELEKIRGSKISMVFQDPMSALNPCFTVGFQLGEVLRIHQGLTGNSLKDRMIELLNQVGIPDPQGRLKAYPHELSGGMSQRVIIAISIACRPELLIADEPTTALDVTVQKQIMKLLDQLRKQNKMSMILVSHDLGLVSSWTDKILVMYAGESVEFGASKSLLESPKHPYTKGLMQSLPDLYPDPTKDFRLPTIPGVVPNLAQRPTGCQFSPRCGFMKPECEVKPIAMRDNSRCLFSFQFSKHGEFQPLKNSELL